MTRDGLKYWYNGYCTHAGERLYNPHSVVMALENNNFGNYWTSSGPYDEIYYYIEQNVAAVRDDLALLVSGIEVPSVIEEYAATSMDVTTKEEIFSAMVVYGFLSYDDGNVYIPNKELMDKFVKLPIFTASCRNYGQLFSGINSPQQAENNSGSFSIAL